MIECPADWMADVNGVHVSTLGPCDRRGWIPNAATWAFDLDWEYQEPTHLACGLLTEYGEKWLASWEELKAKAIADERGGGFESDGWFYRLPLDVWLAQQQPT